MIRQLVLENWGPFRGQHVITFEKKTYAIIAEYAVDPGRSNWGGKSMLLEAIQFAIDGSLNKDRRYDADGWITRGEKSGGVGIVFWDQSSIKRTRIRGQSTQIRYSNLQSEVASQKEAENAIGKYLGFGEDEFDTIAYFKPKQMSRIIRTEPEKRLEVVRGWLGLEPAEKAEKLASELAKARVRELQKLKTRRTTIQSLIESQGEIPDVKKLTVERDQAQEKLDELQKQWQLHRDLRGYQKIIDDYRRLVEVGKATAEEVTKAPADIEERSKKADEVLAKKNALLEEARNDLAKKQKVALGLFDGHCPVAPIECPVKKKINADRKASAEAAKEAERIENERLVEADLARRVALKRSNELHARNRNQEKLESLREREERDRAEYKAAKKAIKKLKKLPSEDAIREEMRSIQAVRESCIARIAEANQAANNLAKWKAEEERLKADIAMETARSQTLIAAKNVFRTTQRRVAERALNHIGHRANRMLQDNGVDLTIDIQWEREGKKPAIACEMCGTAFPASHKIKKCEECGAERGMHTVQKLQFLLSDRSDAADDFAGIAMQVAAGSWLLSSRHSPWGTLMVDEPFAAMDRTNRRAAAKQLLNLVGSSSYKQAFVISHSQETVDVYPGQIRVIIEKDGTRRIEQV